MNKEKFLNGFEFIEKVEADFDDYSIFLNQEAQIYAFGRTKSNEVYILSYSIDEDDLVDKIEIHFNEEHVKTCNEDEASAILEVYGYVFDHLLRVHREVLLNEKQFKMLVQHPSLMERYYDWKIVQLNNNDVYISWQGFSENGNVDEFIFTGNGHVLVFLHGRNHVVIVHEDDETEKPLAIFEWFENDRDGSARLNSEVYDPKLFDEEFGTIVNELIHYLLYELEYNFVVTGDSNILTLDNSEIDNSDYIWYNSEIDGLLFRRIC